MQRTRELYFQYWRFTSGFRDLQFLWAIGIAGAAGTAALRVNLATQVLRPSGVQGISYRQFSAATTPVLKAAEQVGGEAFVHGSRAAGTARSSSDVDIAIRVTPERFNQLILERFGAPNEGSAKLNTMLRAINSGKIQAGELRLSNLRLQLESTFGKDVDISAIQIGGATDNGPYVPFKTR